MLQGGLKGGDYIPYNEKEMQEFMLGISKQLRLGISSPNVDPTTGGDLPNTYTGVSADLSEDGVYRIWLTRQIIQPLMRDNLSPSVRLVLQFHVALTLLHEFAVSNLFTKITCLGSYTLISSSIF
jgi:hypothetical protein